MTSSPQRILSGIQPSGMAHLGNYFGAIRQYVELQEQGEALYFIADFHALTTMQDRQRLPQMVRDLALDYLALGLDPNKAVLFRQSDVPEVCELTWLLSTCTGLGLLERATSYKDKVARGIKPRAGLFFYPVLMAADILIYGTNVVPVGKDQVQHIEMTQDMADSFHAAYDCEVFVRPEARLVQSAAVVPGIDGQKMSKSYDNTIAIFAEGKPLKKRVMSIVTDSKGVDEAKDPETCNAYLIYKLVATPEQAAEMAQRLSAGGYGYGDAKKALLQAIDERFGDARERRRELVAQPDYVDDVLAAGAKHARRLAQEVVGKAREAVGLRGAPVGDLRA
ncbi:MAG: tryptophan--tRNA ligase [Planctomycetota bacterium]|nr:MAG: tryptophan--tRNA ligase [Planctomycetota bacterium]